MSDTAQTTVKPQIQFADFLKLDLRAATVTAAEPHPNADKLIKIQLDDGTGVPRQVCAGIKAWYEPQDLVGTALWLLSDAAAFVTGVVVPVDGGFSAYSGV